jgi:hypothetical protein
LIVVVVLLVGVVGAAVAGFSYLHWCQGASGSQDPISFTIPGGATGAEVISSLHSNGVIRCDALARYIARARLTEFQAGDYKVQTNMTLDAALDRLGEGPIVRTVSLSRPAALFVELGVPILSILLLSRRKTILSEGTRNIVQAMERAGIKRFVCESSLGVGDSKWKLGIFHNLIAIPLFLRNILADKEEQERIIARSSLDWVIVRPTALTNGPQRNAYRAGADVGHWFIPSRISRADVAAFMLEQVTGGEYLRKTPGLSN